MFVKENPDKKKKNKKNKKNKTAQKMKFPIKNFPVNVTKSAVSSGLIEKVLNGKLNFLCSVDEMHIFTLFYFIYRYPDEQKSKEIFLEVGKKYYLEGLFVAQGGDDHIEIGVYLPDGSSLLPITSYYLSADAN